MYMYIMHTQCAMCIQTLRLPADAHHADHETESAPQHGSPGHFQLCRAHRQCAHSEAANGQRPDTETCEIVMLMNMQSIVEPSP